MSTRSSQSTAFGPYVRMPMALSSADPVGFGSTPSTARRQVPLNGGCSGGVAAEDAPDGLGRLGAVVAEPVRGGRREADRVARAEPVGVEADVDLEVARQQVAELLAGVAHEAALAGGAGAGLVGDPEELHARERPGGEAAPQHPRLKLQGLVAVGPLERDAPPLTSADHHLRARL